MSFAWWICRGLANSPSQIGKGVYSHTADT